jgi:glucose/mannose-6-phosphate isomerase
VTPPQFLDTLGLWGATTSLPEQIQASCVMSGDQLEGTQLPTSDWVRSVAIFGLGASGLAAQAVAAYAAGRAPVPVWVGQSDQVPAFVGPGTLVVALSRSGETADIRTAARTAINRGARLIAVTGDGPLGELAATSNQIHLAVTDDAPTSRAALGALVVPLLLSLEKMGLLPGVTPSLQRAALLLARRRDSLVAPGGPAEDVARRIGRTMPLVYGVSGLSAVAAQRWKTQINENAKTPAFFAALPDLAHNEVAGWGQHGDVTRQVFTLVTLRHRGEAPNLARQFELVVDATDEVMAEVIPVWAEGDDELGRFFDHVLFGDLVSLYVAGREGIDPGPVPAVGDVEAGLRSPGVAGR